MFGRVGAVGKELGEGLTARVEERLDRPAAHEIGGELHDIRPRRAGALEHVPDVAERLQRLRLRATVTGEAPGCVETNLPRQVEGAAARGAGQMRE